jgi:DNA polymerase-1
LLVTTLDALNEVVAYFREEADFFAFDVETTGDHRLDTWRNDVVWLTVADSRRSWSIPVGFPNGDFVEERYPLKDSADLRDRLARGLPPRKSDYSVNRNLAHKVFTDPPEHLSRTEVFSALKTVFFDDTILKVGHNLAFDLGSVAKYLGGIPAGPYADTRIAAFLVDSDKAYGFGLKDVAKKYANIDMVKGVGKFVEKHSFDEVHEYALLDVQATAKVWEILRDKIKESRLTQVFRLEMDVLPVVTQMKLIGAPIDMDQLGELRRYLESDIEKVKSRIFHTAGRTFTLTSNSEKQALLFGPKKGGGRGLKPTVLTPGGKERQRQGKDLAISDYSVSAEALEAFRGQDLLVDQILEYQGLNKLLSTYVLPYLGADGNSGLVDKGRIHTDFNQIGAATGRFSSSNPNLQNVPGSGTEYGKKIRNLFVAPPGHQLVVADYSQIEPRLIAAFSKDPLMVKTYQDGGDIYTAIGNKMGVDRKAGKVLVLSIAYGVGPAKISKSIGCTPDEAKDLLGEFSAQFPCVDRLKANTITKALQHAERTGGVPYVCTISGRRRYLPDLTHETFWIRLRAQRQAFNTLIQGSAADIMKMAIVFADQDIPEPAYLTLTVHDELVVVTPDEFAEETARIVKSSMEGVGEWAGVLSDLNVPLVAEVNIASRWGEAK